MFILHYGRGTILLLLYVDDVIITGRSSELIRETITGLANEFAMKDLGPLYFFLRIEVKYFKESMYLSQRKYATEIL